LKKQKLYGAAEDTVTKLAAFQSPEIQAEYFNALQEKVFRDASPLELDAMKFQGYLLLSSGLILDSPHFRIIIRRYQRIRDRERTRETSPVYY